MTEFLISLIKYALSVLSPIAIFLLIIYLNPNKFQHWMHILDDIFYKASSGIPKINSYFDRRAVASSIQDTVNDKCEKINKDASDIIPYPLKIEWVKSEDPQAFIQHGETFVRLRHYKNQDRNIVDATMMYLEKALLPDAKVFLDGGLRKSCEYKVGKQILRSMTDTGAYAYYIDNQINPALKNNTDLKQDMDMLDDLDRVGFFTHVFLREIKLTGDKLYDTTPNTDIENDLRSFAFFLRTIAIKRPEERPPLVFNGRLVRVAIVLVARYLYLETYGRKPYIRRISINVQEGYDTIYVTGWGEEFIEQIIEIKKEIEGKYVTIPRRYNFDVTGNKKAILLVCKPKPGYIARQQQLKEEVKQVMAEIVPEFSNGQIEIVSIAREKGLGCKIAVRSSVEGDTDATLRACKGENNERFDTMKSRLSNEFLEIIPWSPDIKRFITNALYPLEEQDIKTIHLDEVNLVADVEVCDDGAYDKALGIDYQNTTLAMDLTEWQINIKKPRQAEAIPTADEDLRKIVTDIISNIKNNEIEIVKLARIEGVGSRIVVKWRNGDRSTLASGVCKMCLDGHSLIF